MTRYYPCPKLFPEIALPINVNKNLTKIKRNPVLELLDQIKEVDSIISFHTEKIVLV